jgi:hypothetical protein
MRYPNPYSALVAIILWLVSHQSFAQNSVLATGAWYKITIPKTGVYKLDYNQLRQLGVAVDGIDPRNIKIYGNPGGMLPQANAAPRPADLIENAIVVSGEGDGVFNSSDQILFYAQGPDKQTFNVATKTFAYEQNLYTDKNYYFLTLGDEPGKRIAQADLTTGLTTVNTFEDVVHHELTRTNILKSGREWFGERFDRGTETTISVDLEGIVAGSEITITSDVVGYSLAGSSFSVSVNGTTIGNQSISLVPNSQYGIKARHQRDDFTFSSDLVNAASRTSQRITYQFAANGTASAYGHLDFFTLTCTRALAVYGMQTSFRSAGSLSQSTSTFSVDRANASTQVWNVTNPSTPVLYTLSLSGNVATFHAATTVLQEFIAFNQALSPEAISKINNQNLRGISSTSLLIVTDDELLSEAQRLADHRAAFSGISVNVVTVNEIFNEFSSGRPDVTAIRDFARHLNTQYPGTFQNLLLFGRGTYDYKNVIRDNVNRVLTYESRNSISPLETYSSDDYYALLEESEGNWLECFSCNETLDIGVGRIPAKTREHAKNIVDKIITYETDASLTGSWQTKISFVADDGDFNIHQAQADQLAIGVETTPSSIFNTQKIYIDAFEQISKPAGQVAPEVNTVIRNTFMDGSLVINYTGHGNEYLWAQEQVLNELLVANTNNERLPFLVTATCEFGRHDDPLVTSVAEVALLRKKHGAIGLVTTARPVNSSTNFGLNQAFYEAFLSKTNGRFQSLGQLFRQTKNKSASGVANRNFSLLGDPSMTLAFPAESIVVDEVVTHESTDTLRALSTVTVRGRVLTPASSTDSEFNGILETSIFDKAGSFKTLGNESTPFTYKQWSTLIFKGKANVKNGLFEFSFIVPKNIAYAVGEGRMDLFARSENKTAAGVSSITIGGSSSGSEIDATPPVLSAFMNDTTFVNGGIVSSDTRLVVRLFDDSGINISSLGVGNDLTAILDNETVFDLNAYYTADIDNFKKGTVTFPITGLSEGKHTIRVKAWDTFNNSAEAVVEFTVTSGNGFTIEAIGNYPNPFERESTVFFTHNKAGEDLDVTLYIYNAQGKEVNRITYEVPESNYRVDLPFSLENDLPAGIYVTQLLLRSLATGQKARASTKLIITN